MNNPNHRKLISDSDLPDFLLEHRQRLAVMVATHITSQGYLAPVSCSKHNRPIVTRDISRRSDKNNGESLAA